MNFKKSLIIFAVMVTAGGLSFKLLLPAAGSKLHTASIGTVAQTDNPAFVTISDHLGPSIVAIQSFNGGKLLRAGSGLVLTQDGWVVTLNSLVPPEADFFQVLIDNKLDRGRVLMRDAKSGLAVVSVDDKGFLPANLSFLNISEEKNLVVVSQFKSLDKSSSLVDITPISDIKNPDSKFAGGAVVTQDGQIVGLLDFDAGLLQVINVSSIEKIFTDLILHNNG